MRSLRTRLVVYAFAGIAATVAILGTLSYRQTLVEFRELGDARLVQATRTIDALAENAGLRKIPPGSPIDVQVWHSPFIERTVTSRGHAYQVRLGFQYWNDDGRLLLTSDNFQHVPLAAAAGGFADVSLSDGEWRIYTLRDEDGDVIRAGERDEGRSALARVLLWEHFAPLLVALVGLGIFVGWAVRRGLRPLDTLSQRLANRQPEESTPIALTDVPRELEPMLSSLNGLIARVRTALDREKRFAADAAHQLRTPLAAALLNLENAMAIDSGELRNLALHRAQEGLTRLQHLVDQFLELARWEGAERRPAAESVDLERCVRAELEEAAMLAADKDLELGIVVNAPATRITGWTSAVHALVRNLIDNAFRYTPARGRVDVEIHQDGRDLILDVFDSGPGIPVEERAAVLERFHRGGQADIHGSGLGLAIVCRVAELHGASVELSNSRFATGLRVRVRFPGRVVIAVQDLTPAASDA